MLFFNLAGLNLEYILSEAEQMLWQSVIFLSYEAVLGLISASGSF